MKLEIYASEVGSPREDSNLGIIAYRHRNYILGEERVPELIDWLEEKLGLAQSYEYTQERFSELSAKFQEKFVSLPLYLYDHSGITMSTSPFSCRWDSGQVGFIYTTPEKMREWFGVKRVSAKRRAKALEYLQGEVEYFDQYLRGNVYGFRVVDADGEEVDSCGGFIGDLGESGIVEEVMTYFPDLTEEQVVEMVENTEIEY